MNKWFNYLVTSDYNPENVRKAKDFLIDKTLMDMCTWININQIKSFSQKMTYTKETSPSEINQKLSINVDY